MVVLFWPQQVSLFTHKYSMHANKHMKMISSTLNNMMFTVLPLVVVAFETSGVGSTVGTVGLTTGVGTGTTISEAEPVWSPR